MTASVSARQSSVELPPPSDIEARDEATASLAVAESNRSSSERNVRQGSNSPISAQRHEAVIRAHDTQAIGSHLQRQMQTPQAARPNRNWKDIGSALGLATIAGLAGAFLHYGLCRTGVEERIKTRKDFDADNPRDIAMMALMSGLALGISYFFVNRTVSPLAKFGLERAGLRRVDKNSVADLFPTAVHSSDGIALDVLSEAGIGAAGTLAAKEKRSFENKTRLYKEGGLVGDIFGHASFGVAQFVVAILGYSGLWPRVTGTLAGTAVEALLDTFFKLRQNFDFSENRGKRKIATYSVAKRESAKEGWTRVKNRMREANIFASKESARVFLHHVAGGVAATELSNMIKYLGRDAHSPLAKAFVAFWAAVFVVSPVYATTEFEPATEAGDASFRYTRTALHAILAPFMASHPLVPHASREPDTPAGSRPLRFADNIHKCTQGVQAIVPYAMADTLIKLGELVWSCLAALPPSRNDAHGNRGHTGSS
jgi:hypothetical protein